MKKGHWLVGFMRYRYQQVFPMSIKMTHAVPSQRCNDAADNLMYHGGLRSICII